MAGATLQECNTTALNVPAVRSLNEARLQRSCADLVGLMAAAKAALPLQTRCSLLVNGLGVKFELLAQQVQVFEFPDAMCRLKQAAASASINLQQSGYGTVSAH